MVADQNVETINNGFYIIVRVCHGDQNVENYNCFYIRVRICNRNDFSN